MREVGTIELLREFESRNVTYIAEDGSWPMVWERARGVQVWDEAGRRYLDLTGAFGVAAAGHANRAVVRAGGQQMGQLLHAMGDVHPHRLKGELARELSRITFERWGNGRGKVIFGSSGFEAVEAALKTAMLATGKRGIVSFAGGYHGLGYGALNATERQHFRAPFRRQLAEFGRFARFPAEESELAESRGEMKALLGSGEIGGVIVEPVQARGGIHIPPSGFLPMLREECDTAGALLIVDEIYTGFGRTGRWFACEREGTVPDVICLGKALTGGFPLSACIGKAEVMDRAWPPSNGEAIHTSTFLGHPVGCAMALAQIGEVERRGLCEASAEKGEFLLGLLSKLAAASSEGKLRFSARGMGLMAGLEIGRQDGAPAMEETLELIKRLLRSGFIFLPEGEHANVLSWTPPLTISRRQLRSSVTAVREELRGL